MISLPTARTLQRTLGLPVTAGIEALSPVLRDRLAFHLDLTPLSIRDLDASGFSADAIAEAREKIGAYRGQAPAEA